MPIHIMIKLANLKIQRTLKAAREKQRIIQEGTPIRLSAYLSAETLLTKREWHNIFKVGNEKSLPPSMLYPASLSFKVEEEIKSFPFRQKLNEYIITILALQEMLTVLL